MKQIFIKTVNGVSLQFIRLLYPVRYQIKKDGIDQDGELYEIGKDDEGTWQFKNNKQIPKWLIEIFEDICFEIEVNESNHEITYEGS